VGSVDIKKGKTIEGKSSNISTYGFIIPSRERRQELVTTKIYNLFEEKQCDYWRRCVQKREVRFVCVYGSCYSLLHAYRTIQWRGETDDERQNRNNYWTNAPEQVRGEGILGIQYTKARVDLVY
jgi:hypothetical protein